MAYGSPSSKKKKGSALRGLFVDPVEERGLVTAKDIQAVREEVRRLEKLRKLRAKQKAERARQKPNPVPAAPIRKDAMK